MKKGVLFVIIAVLILAVFGAIKLTGNMVNSEKVEIQTSEGNIVLELYEEKAPITVANFKKYVNEGFYDNTVFHRVIEGFMIQGGGFSSDREEKETYAPIKLESNNGLSNKRGTIAMARTNVPDSATAQFFINTKDNDFLDYGQRDKGYAVFGKVIKGMDVVDSISKAKTNADDWPLEEIKIIKISFV